MEAFILAYVANYILNFWLLTWDWLAAFKVLKLGDAVKIACFSFVPLIGPLVVGCGLLFSSKRMETQIWPRK